MRAYIDPKTGRFVPRQWIHAASSAGADASARVAVPRRQHQVQFDERHRRTSSRPSTRTAACISVA
jgi:hypothetical protein